MKLTILGSGTLVPNASRNSAGYFVELPNARVMMDCGAGTLHALARYRCPWEHMTHLFVSHFHADHIGELGSLLLAFRYGLTATRSEPLIVLGPPGLDNVIEGLRMALGSKLLDAKFPVTIRTLGPGQQVSLGSESTLSVEKTLHTPESLAVRIESSGHSLCYTGDTAYSEDLASFFYRADVLISECSFREPREDVRHLSIEQASRLASIANVGTLIVTHFYFEVNDEQLESQLKRNFRGEVIIARDGLCVEIPRS